MNVLAVLLILGAYLLGALPIGLLIARARGVDVRTVGSGNIGATNVARAVGMKLGLLTLVLDIGKGLVPVLAARFLGLTPWAVAAVGLAALLGHIFPVYLRLRGGKGVATALGVLLGIEALAGACGFVVYAIVYASTRISSVGSLSGAAVAPIVAYFLGTRREYLVLCVVVLALVVWRHRENIQRLIRGQEGKV